jgi:hypothetical protein
MMLASTDKDDPLSRLQKWFSSNCDGDWEHDTGFSIDVLDNPGWSIELRLETLGLRIDDRKELNQRSEQDWVAITIQSGLLGVYCGPLNLGEAIDVFLSLVTRPRRAADQD